MRRADQGGRAAEGEGRAEEIIGGAVAGGESFELSPTPAAAVEEIGFPLAGVTIHGGNIRADERFAAREVDGVAEVIAGGAVARGELLRFAQGANRAAKDISRALAEAALNGGVVGADQRRPAIERDGFAEAVIRCAITGGELLG